MSDIADRCEASVGAAEGAGARFEPGRAPAQAPAGVATLPDCACGGRPAYRPHALRTARDRPTETLACGRCGSSVGPMPARHQLAAAWRLYGRKGAGL